MNLPVRRYFALLVAYLKPQWWRALLMALFLLIGIGLQLFSPQILRYFIDTATTNGTSTSLLAAGVLFISVALLKQGVAIATAYLTGYVAWTATNQLRTDLVAHCLSLDMSFHQTRTPGELIERIDGDVDTLSDFFSQFVVNLLSNTLLLVAILVLFFNISWLVGIAMSIFSLAVLLLLVYLRRRAIPFWVEQRQMSAIFYGFLSERLGGAEDIRANGATAYILRRFYLLLRQWLPIFRKATVAGADMGIITLFLFVCGSALALMLGAYLWSIRAITVGTVYLMFAYTDLLSQPINQIQTQLQNLQQAEACMQRVEELLATTSVLSDGWGAPLPQGALSVDFLDVSFSYVEHEPVIQRLSFSIEPGKVVGVLGRTGSGKTTLARLLFRLYDPQSGEICVGGVPIHTTHLSELRQGVGIVTQDVQLFQATIRDNLTFFNASIPDTRILEAVERVGLTSWYRMLPHGLDSQLGADGEGLSAGEAQLLAFTRVFLSNPGLVILDEASSRLDPATERLIEQAMDALFVGRTVLVIAHRLATVRRVDDILIIEAGRVCEYAPRADLASDPDSRFYRLLQSSLEEMPA
jgi:ATP-binding cassette, subfamily B, bacterial